MGPCCQRARRALGKDKCYWEHGNTLRYQEYKHASGKYLKYVSDMHAGWYLVGKNTDLATRLSSHAAAVTIIPVWGHMLVSFGAEALLQQLQLREGRCLTKNQASRKVLDKEQAGK